MATVEVELGGVLPVFSTLFDEDGRVDCDAIADELRWIFGWKVGGVVLGMVSDCLRLTGRERMDVARVACDTAKEFGSGAIISVGSESARRAAQFAVQAEELGAMAVMAIPPIATDLSDAALSGYYSSILDAVTIPLVVQDASGYVGRSLSIELQSSLLERYGSRVLFKPEAAPIGPRLSSLRNMTAGKARVFEGTGGIALIDSYRRGIVGTMPGADLSWALVALWNMLIEGDEVNAYRLNDALVSLLLVQTNLDAFVVVQRYLLWRQGVIKLMTERGPLNYVMDEETCSEIDRRFERLRQAYLRIVGVDPCGSAL